MAYLKVENSAQTTFRFSPVSFLPPRSSLLETFLSYEENQVLCVQHKRLNSQHFIFFITYKSVQNARVLVTDKLSQPGVI